MLAVPRVGTAGSCCVIQVHEIAVLDCNAGLHILPGHPLEVGSPGRFIDGPLSVCPPQANLNLRGLRFFMNWLQEEVTDMFRCESEW
jgi:hypothetical protein